MPAIKVSAVLLIDDQERVLTVRKRGTERFMLPGGKPEPGETPAECAVRECREEVGAELLPGDLVHLGLFTAPAANEEGETVEAEVFSHAAPDDLAAASEIEEVRWLDRSQPLPDDLAPMLTGAVLPALETSRSFTFRRPFGWGIVAIGDLEATELPELGGAPVSATAQAVIARVRSAADASAPAAADAQPEAPVEVTVRVHVDVEPPADPTWQGVLETSSEGLVIGDADSEVEIEVDSVRCAVALRLDPADEADLLEIWVNGAE